MSKREIGVKPDIAQQLLPTYAYTSEEWFEREQNELFNRAWVFACTVDDVPNKGDFATLQVGKYPLVVIHGDDGEIRAFHNICRHRGAKVLEGNGQIKRSIVCPYHRWSYSTEGDLKAIPQQDQLFPNVDKCTLNLKKASLGNYRNLLFVHPQESPEESFEDYLADMPDNTWPGKSEDLKVLVRQRWEINCNWKNFVENAEDGYHLMHLHKDTLKGPRPEGQDWRAVGRHWIWDGTEAIYPRMLEAMSEEDMAAAANSSWEPVPGTPLDTYGAQVYKFFPNFLVMPLLDNISFAKITPLSAQKTLVEVAVLVPAWQDEKGHQEKLEGLLAFAPLRGMEINAEGWVNDGIPMVLSDFPEPHPLKSGNFHLEDMWQVEMMQTGMNSPAYEMGPMAPEAESALTYFQQNILDYVPLEAS